MDKESVHILTASRIKFYPWRADQSMIDLYDIAYGLANTCRFGGHTAHFYSVAQHSVLISEYLDDLGVDAALWGLLHDAGEAYLGDVVTPIKRLFPDFVALENSVLRVVAAKFQMDPAIPESVHIADRDMLATEAIALTADPLAIDLGGGEALDVPIQPWAPEYARQRFIDRAHDLLSDRRRAAV